MPRVASLRVRVALVPCRQVDGTFLSCLIDVPRGDDGKVAAGDVAEIAKIVAAQQRVKAGLADAGVALADLVLVDDNQFETAADISSALAILVRGGREGGWEGWTEAEALCQTGYVRCRAEAR